MKHVIDQARGRHNSRLKRFTAAERMRGQKARTQVEVLRRLPKGLSASLRVRRFLEIERTAL